jgi:hypothetical protein
MPIISGRIHSAAREGIRLNACQCGQGDGHAAAMVILTRFGEYRVPERQAGADERRRLQSSLPIRRPPPAQIHYANR